MPVTSTAVYPQAINLGLGNILPADTTTIKTIFTAGANGSLIQALGMSSTDTSARDVVFYITRGGSNYLLCTVTCPLNSGNTAVLPAIDVLRNSNVPWLTYDMAGNRQLRLMSGDTLTFASLTTVTAAKSISGFADGENL